VKGFQISGKTIFIVSIPSSGGKKGGVGGGERIREAYKPGLGTRWYFAD